MKLTVDLSELIATNIDDDDFYSDHFDIEIDLINQKIAYVEAMRKAFFNKRLARHELPQAVADWLFAALGDPKDTQKVKLEFVYVSDGKAAAMDGYRLHVYDVEGVADGAYYLLNNLLIEAKDAPKAPDWSKVLPKGDSKLVDVDSADHSEIGSIPAWKWYSPVNIVLNADYCADALLLGKPDEMHVYGSKIATKFIWPNALAVIMPMHI